MFSSNSRPPSQHMQSINVVKHASYFSSVDEELRDCKRVQRQGQEEDLREALSRMMTTAEEMCETLKSSYQTTADLETQLTLAESNLKLALANNEMLEDALKSGSLSKDVGWRRSSREASSSQSFPSPGITAAGTSDSPGSDRDSCRAPSPPATAPPPQSDSRFFGFRFSSSGRSTPTHPTSPPPPRTSRLQRTPHPVGGHLTSASLPSLVASPSPPPVQAQPPPIVNNELEELREQLLAEKCKSEKITQEKSELESELETLSQALFEEANKMVKVERIKRAEAEDELKEVHAEKDALKSALRLVEEDRLRVESIHEPHVNGVDPSAQDAVATHSRTSSQDAIISPRLHATRDSPTPPSPPPPSAESPSEPRTEMMVPTAGQEQDKDGAAPPSPAPLYVPPPPHHLVDSAPASRAASPKPLPHPHRLSHLRTGAPPTAPAPPPPSAADGFPISPWGRPSQGGGEEDSYAGDENVEPDLDALQGFSVPQIVTLHSPGEVESVPWGKW